MTKNIKKIGIIVKISNPEAINTCATAARWLTERGVNVLVEGKIAAQVECAVALSGEELAREADALLVLGGDGTMLHTVRLLGGRNIPCTRREPGGLRLSYGRYGIRDVPDPYEKLITGDFKTEERMLLSVKILTGRKDGNKR